MRIGIFDSGVGGLGIYSEIKKLLPQEDIIYLADSANCPYGEKSTDEIRLICKKNTDFLIGKGAQIIVAACNSASVSALNWLREQFAGVPIVGVVPVVKTAREQTRNKRVGILATKRTVESKYLRQLVEKFLSANEGYRVFYQAANPLVQIVESSRASHNLSSSGLARGSRNLIMDSCLRRNDKSESRNDLTKKYLQSFIKNNVDAVALGCTHFPFLRPEIEAILGENVKVLDSNAAVARQVAVISSRLSVHGYRFNSNIQIQKPKTLPCRQAGENRKPCLPAGRLKTENRNKYQFYTSGDAAQVSQTAQNLLKDDLISFKQL